MEPGSVAEWGPNLHAGLDSDSELDLDLHSGSVRRWRLRSAWGSHLRSVAGSASDLGVAVLKARALGLRSARVRMLWVPASLDNRVPESYSP